MILEQVTCIDIRLYRRPPDVSLSFTSQILVRYPLNVLNDSRLPSAFVSSFSLPFPLLEVPLTVV